MRALGDYVEAYNESGGSGELRPDRVVYLADFSLGDKVYVDGDTSMKFTVTTMSWSNTRCHYELGWFNGGIYYEKWFESWRLRLVDPVDNSDPARGTWSRP